MRPNSSQIDPTWTGAVLGIGACVVALSTTSSASSVVIALAAVPLLARVVWRSMPLWFLLVATTVPVNPSGCPTASIRRGVRSLVARLGG